jgi:quercetin dioxygenase-like cupin family protein
MKAPANSLILGHEHTTTSINIILSGEIDVCVDGNVRSFKAGDIFISTPGSWKIGHVKKDLRFLNVHPNPDDTQDQTILESRFIKKSEQLLNHEEEKKLLWAGSQ